MSDAEELRDADFEQASSQLNQGLKSCRAVVDNYRAILAGENPANDDDRNADYSRYLSGTEIAANSDTDWGETG